MAPERPGAEPQVVTAMAHPPQLAVARKQAYKDIFAVTCARTTAVSLIITLLYLTQLI